MKYREANHHVRRPPHQRPIAAWLVYQGDTAPTVFVFAFLFRKSLQVSIALCFFMGPFAAPGLIRFPSARELGAFKFMIPLENWNFGCWIEYDC